VEEREEEEAQEVLEQEEAREEVKEAEREEKEASVEEVQVLDLVEEAVEVLAEEKEEVLVEVQEAELDDINFDDFRKPYKIEFIVVIMKKVMLFVYDDFADRLFISCKKEGEKVYGSVRMLNLTIDFTRDMKVINMELRKASEHLKSIGINPAILDNLSEVSLTFRQQRDGYLIYFILKSGEKVERVPYNIITAKPIFSQIA